MTKESSGGWLCPDSVSVDVEAPIGVLDLSARPTTAVKCLGILSVSQLMNFPRQEFCEFYWLGAKSVAEVQSKLFRYLSGAVLNIFASHVGNKSTSVSQSLGTRRVVNAMLHRLTKQQREITAKRFGLWNRPPETLRHIGKKSGLSGEWIHQLENQSFARLHGMFGHGVLSEFVGRKIGNYLNADPEVKCGVLTREEAISCIADDCSQEQAEKALLLFNDIECSGKELPAGDMLARHLLEVDLEVYCVSKTAARRYTLLLKRIEIALQEKPLSESELRDEILGPRKSEQLRLMDRILSISPSITHLAEGQITLSSWIEIHGRSARGRAEAALLHLGRPAHYREIGKNIRALFKISKGAQERTVQLSVQSSQTFVRVGKGTYGLKAWGLRAEPRRKRATA